MDHLPATDEHVIELLLTRAELETIAYAMTAFNEMIQNMPRVEHMVSKSDAMSARRACKAFNARIQDLAQGYGIEVPAP